MKIGIFFALSAASAAPVAREATATMPVDTILDITVSPISRITTRDLLQHIPHQRSRPDFGAIDDAPLSRGAAFRRAGRAALIDRVRDEIFHRAVLGAADAHAALPAVMILGHRFRFGIADIDRVLRIDIDAARPRELRPGRKQLSVLIENIDAIVVAIADEQTPLRIHRQRMWNIELAGGSAFHAPLLDEFAG